MTTTPIETWAVDLADVTFIYPGVGWEFGMAVVAFVLWIAWQIWQCRFEQETYKAESQKYGNAENIKNSINDG